MKHFIVMIVVLYMSLLTLRNTTTASVLDNYFEDDSIDYDGRALVNNLEEYVDKNIEDEELIYPNLQKRKEESPSKYRKSCVPRGGNCDHRPKNCCNSGSCRCNLWGANCKCQRMGFFQKWGKRLDH